MTSVFWVGRPAVVRGRLFLMALSGMLAALLAAGCGGGVTILDGDTVADGDDEGRECHDEGGIDCDGLWSRICQGGTWVRVADCSIGGRICLKGRCEEPPDGDADRDPDPEGDSEPDGDATADGDADLEESPVCDCGPAVTACCDGCAWTTSPCTPEDEHALGGRCAGGTCLIERCMDGWKISVSRLRCEPELIDGDADGPETETPDGDTHADAEPDGDPGPENDTEPESEQEPGDECMDGPCCRNGRWVERGGECVGGQDDFACTDDACDEGHACSLHTLQPGKCLIGAACYGRHQTKTGFQCLWCDPDESPTGWSDRPEGEPCDDGNPCSFGDRCDGGGSCLDGRPIACVDDEGICAARRACDGSDTCAVSYAPPLTPCESDDLPCTDDLCDGQGLCEHSRVELSCIIDGVCYPQSTPNPANDCQWCDAARDSGEWTDREPGTACGEGPTDCSSQDTCNGGGVCQPNHTTGAVPCGDAGTECVNQDRCDGNGGCRDNGFKPGGTLCGEGPSACSNQDTCNGGGVCQPNHKTDTVPCGDAGTQCTNQDLCDGNGGCRDNGFKPGGTLCGEGPSACSNQDTCNGGGVCQPNHKPLETACGEVGTECAIQDRCDGNGVCRDGGVAPSGTVCGDPESECVYQDRCDGNGGCFDNGFKPVWVTCGSAATECSRQDTCSGAGVCLPNHQPIGTACGDTGTECTHQDRCDGNGGCVDNGIQPGGTACGDAQTACLNQDLCSDDGRCLDMGAKPDVTPCQVYGQCILGQCCTQPCTGAFDCFDTPCGGSGCCAERGNCNQSYFPYHRIDCTSNGYCGGNTVVACQQVEIDGFFVDEHRICLERRSCIASGSGYYPCCTAGEFCGSLEDNSTDFGVACCRPGETLDTQGLSSTRCYVSTAKNYLCRTDRDCPDASGNTSWKLGRCIGKTSSGFGRCVQCVESSHCSSPTPFCVSNICRQCTANAHCAAPTPYCSGYRCVECTSNSQCPTAKPTCSSNVCVAK